MSTLDSNTKVGIGILVTIITLGGGAIWKVADLSSKLDSINSRLAEVVSQQGLAVTRIEYESRHSAMISWIERVQKEVDAIREARSK